MPSYIGEVTDYRNLFLDQPATRTFVLTSIIRVDDFLLCCCKDFSDSILTQTWQLSPFLFRNFNPYQLIAKDELDIKHLVLAMIGRLNIYTLQQFVIHFYISHLF